MRDLFMYLSFLTGLPPYGYLTNSGISAAPAAPPTPAGHSSSSSEDEDDEDEDEEAGRLQLLP